MAIAHDVTTRWPATDITGVDATAGTRTFTHTPIGTPKGVAVVIWHQVTTAPCTGVSYGGVPMTLQTFGTDTSESMRIEVWVLLSGIPTGPQTVQLDGCSASNKAAACSTVTAATAFTAVAGFAKKDTTTSSNPTLTVVTTDTSLLFGGLATGHSDATQAAPGSGYTTTATIDTGGQGGRMQRRTSPVAAGSIAFNWSLAISEDHAIAAVALAESTVGPFAGVYRVSQAPVETLLVLTPPLQLSQLAVEVITVAPLLTGNRFWVVIV